MQDLDRYNVIWSTPSKDASGSMPLGNGDLAANVWVEEATGDVLLLLAKSDASDENSINLKLGRVRLKLSPLPDIKAFRQTLRLETGDIEIRIGGVSLMIWADANEPVLYIDAESESSFELKASLEIWRTEPRTIKTQTGDLFKRLDGPDPFPTIVSPDRVLEETDGRVIWCHHNEPREHDGFEINLKLQGLGEMIGQMQHPLRGRTFGAVMTRPISRAMKHRVAIHALTLHPATIEQWRDAIEQQVAKIESHAAWVERNTHEQWWRAFWQKSWIDCSNFEVSRAYVLQRFMNACAGRGKHPIKFNGSLFTVGKPDDPDFRRWGGPGFWFMNQRLIYWPMLAAGDLDLMMPWLGMYLDMLSLQRHRTQTYFHHGGAHFPETITLWGAEVSAHYGWTPFEQRARPEAECSYVTYYWTCGLELTLLLLLWYDYGDRPPAFARQFLLPIADAVIEFYDLHYPRDPTGKLRVEPSQALETWQDATNPTPDIAGLRYVLPKLLALPESLTTPLQRERWNRLMLQVPSIPTGKKEGRHLILPAERFDKLKNKENPELYAVFPFRLFGAGKSNEQSARDTFAARLHRSHDCWSQDEIQMALFGLADQAKDSLMKRASDASHSESRFPAFWNAFHDWIPDMDHGGVLQLALQFMLMQCEGREIRLLAAWPREWDANFKLHAPYKTIVEGAVKGGKLIELRVTPEARRADVIVTAPL